MLVRGRRGSQFTIKMFRVPLPHDQKNNRALLKSSQYPFYSHNLRIWIFDLSNFQIDTEIYSNKIIFWIRIVNKRSCTQNVFQRNCAPSLSFGPLMILQDGVVIIVCTVCLCCLSVLSVGLFCALDFKHDL